MPVGRTPTEAERRQLTVMFCDLVGSTALSEQLDPEELREMVHTYQRVCGDVIKRFEGHIAQYLGDGLLAYFGYPLAHEDDAQRAVHTGLGILEEMGRVNTGLEADKGLRLAVRIGIHTGLVVVGETGRGDRHEQLALGDTPNIAARLQEIAEPDTAIISLTTYRLIQGFFTCRDSGLHRLKGVSAPVQVYRVLGESGAESRLDAAISTGLTPLVGREQEIGLLLDRWEQVQEDAGHVVFLCGEAGIGKSRLLQAIKDRVSREACTRIEWRCSPYYRNSALYPAIAHLQRLLKFTREDTPGDKLSKLEGMMRQYCFILSEVVPLLASLLSISIANRYPPLNLTPEVQKQRIMEVLLAWLLEDAKKQPLLFMVEDLHWADPSTVELLTLLMDQGPTAGILTVFTFRPDFRPPWTMRSHLTQITLTRLTPKQVEVMVERVAKGKALPAEVLQQVVTKTDGVPLFVEELTKMVLESGLLREQENRYELAGPLAPLAIPSTLQDSLMARLDRLATVKETAQLGATLGREFSYELLQAVSLQDEATLRRELAQLVDAELVYQRGVPPHIRYIFKHALIQGAAYQSLLKSKRQQYHQRIARVLEERFPETGEVQPELLAHHYTEAGLSREALRYWHRAGQLAIEQSANREAIAHLNKGLEVLRTLPDTPERNEQEIGIQIALGVPLIATKGYGAPEVEDAYTRARELSRGIRETPRLFPVLRGLWNCYLLRARLQTAYELGEQLLTLAQKQQDSALLVGAYRVLGSTLFFQGELASAQKYVEEGIALYDHEQHSSLAFLYGADPGVVCRLYLAWLLWLRGYPDQALNGIYDALNLARELHHPFTLAFALSVSAMGHQFRRDGEAVQELADEAIVLCSEQRIAQWLALGNIQRGWVLSERGRREEGAAQMHQGLAAWEGTGADLVRPYYLSLLTEAYGKVGKVEEGLTLLGEALAAADRNGERWWEAELYRLKGELIVRQGVEEVQSPQPGVQQMSEAEGNLRHAVEIARRQGAKSLELRAVMSLSRLLQKQGKKRNARQMLAKIYSWFVEGFDDPDLKKAKELLHELK
ncbi:MAG: AAA family ATPase [Promethearchaeota archaeon]